MNMKRVSFCCCLLGLAACATEEKARAEWGDEAAVTARGGSAALTTQEEFDAYAAGLHSAVRCEEEARAEIRGAPHRAALFIRGCMKRPDFTTFLYFTKPPWNALKFRKADLDLLVHVSLRRGEIDVVEDLKLLGFAVTPYELFRDDGGGGSSSSSSSEGRLVSARVSVLAQRPSDGGTVNTVRLYGLRSSAQSRTFNIAGVDREFVSGNARARNVVPLGLTIDVISPQPLPADRRVFILAAVDEQRSQAAKAAAKARTEALPVEPEGGRLEWRDPPAEAVVRLLVME